MGCIRDRALPASVIAMMLLAAPSSLCAQPARTVAAARLTLDHRMRDMMTYRMVHIEAEVTLETRPDGTATLHLVGSTRSHVATLHPAGGSEATPPSEHPLDQTWTGGWRRDGDVLVIHFERSGAEPTASEVDVEWRCASVTLSVDGRPLPARRCATSQARTRPSGAAHWLPIYMQIPVHLAPPAQHLATQVHASGGADHRSSVDHERFSRAR